MKAGAGGKSGIPGAPNLTNREGSITRVMRADSARSQYYTLASNGNRPLSPSWLLGARAPVFSLLKIQAVT